MASMRNGSGDEYSIAFTADGAFIRGFDHESLMSPFATTASCGQVCSTVYRTCSLRNPQSDGTGEACRAIVADYYELEVDQPAVTHRYAGLPLDDHNVRLLNPDLVLGDVVHEVTTMGERHRA